MQTEFYKYQGTGNDFVMIDNRTNFFPKDDVKLIERFCDRRFGIGADGLILLENDADTDFSALDDLVHGLLTREREPESRKGCSVAAPARPLPATAVFRGVG